MDARQNLGRLVDQLRLAVHEPGPTDESDGQLLQRFRRDCDAGALEVLIRRHGRIVLLACRRQLREAHDVEDCFQAVWLILARKAASIRRPELLASWLYGVARRTAIQVRTSAARRRAREQQAARPEAVPLNDRAELWEVLDRELARLPHIYRTAVLLCDVEGIEYKEAARRLSWPDGTLAGRLARARRLLARRLTQQGITLSAAVLAEALAAPADAAVPAALAILTAEAAALFAGAPGGLTGLASTQAIHIAQEALHVMHLSKLKIVAAVLLALALAAGIGGGLVEFLGGPGSGIEARADDGLGAAGKEAAQPGKGAQPAGEATRLPRPEDKLTAVISVDFKGLPLQDVVAYLRERTSLNLIVDWRALEEQNILKDEPVTLQLEKVPFRTVLRHLARSGAQLGYYFADGVLTLTSVESADQKMVRRVYPVGDFVGADAKGDNLIEVIRKVVDPFSWQRQFNEAGGVSDLGGMGGAMGTGAVAYFAEGRCLVVLQSTRGHEEISELLEELRASRPAQKGK